MRWRQSDMRVAGLVDKGKDSYWAWWRSPRIDS